MKTLIDGDIVVFRSAFACEKRQYVLRWQEGQTARQQAFTSRKELNEFVESLGIDEYEIESFRDIEPLEYATHNMKTTLNGIMDATRSADFAVYLTGSGNFRRAMTRTYKANRDPTMRPHWLQECRNWLIGEWAAQVVDGMEADDAIGIASNDHTICCSIDKDLDTIPGFHYHFVDRRHYFIRPEEAATAFWCQMLTGDKADNVQGLAKVGPATARKMLAGKTEAQQAKAVQQAYKKAGLDFDLNYHLLRILRSEDEYKTLVEAIRQSKVPPADLRYLDP